MAMKNINPLEMDGLEKFISPGHDAVDKSHVPSVAYNHTLFIFYYLTAHVPDEA